MLYYSAKPNIRHLSRISRIPNINRIFVASLVLMEISHRHTETLWIRKQPLITPSGKNKIVFQIFCDTLYYSTVKPTLSIYAAIENTGNNFYIEIKTDIHKIRFLTCNWTQWQYVRYLEHWSIENICVIFIQSSKY